MSRVGNNPISIPEGVSVEIQPNSIIVKGKLGELSQTYDSITIEQVENQLIIKRNNDSKPIKAKQSIDDRKMRRFGFSKMYLIIN